MQEPHPTIPDWTEAVIFTTKDNSIGLDDISYLENHFCKLALNAGRYQVTNGNDPNPGIITEERENELDEIINSVEMVMELLGHNVFSPIGMQTTDFDYDESVLLYMKYKTGEATGRRTGDGFVVLKGSTINPETTQSCLNNVLKAREKYADKISETYELTSDILFPSASAAAGFVSGTKINGFRAWHDSEGRTLKEIEGQ